METFSNVFGFVIAIILGIVILTLFIKLVSLVGSKWGPPALVRMKDFLNDASWINVHLAGGKILERVKFVGFTNQTPTKGGNLPYHLLNMIILETSAGKRILIRSDAVKMIEEID